MLIANAKQKSAIKPPHRASTSSVSVKSKTKSQGDGDSLADRPDISATDRKAASAANAEKILKAEEELASWSEMEELFGSKKPASLEGSLVWYEDMATRCQQFASEFPKSPHANIVRINEARCRIQLFQAKKDPAQRTRAMAAAKEALANKPKENDALRAHFILLNANWPEYPEQGVAEAKSIVKNFPHRKESAAALMLQMQFRRRQGMFKSARETAEQLLEMYPSSEYVINARSMITQLTILQNPCPPLKLAGLRGEVMDSASLRGRPFLIEFWSAKSRTAEEDAAAMVQLYQRYRPQGFEILTICVDKSRDALDMFQARHPLPWPVYWDGNGYESVVARQYGVDTAPMRFLIEPALHRVTSTHLSVEGLAVALDLWIDKKQPPPPPGQEQQPRGGLLHQPARGGNGEDPAVGQASPPPTTESRRSV